MLNKCIGCDTPIPFGATKCPMCGAPVQIAVITTQVQQSSPTQVTQPVGEIHHYHHAQQPPHPILIEQTGKKWKKLYLISWLFFFFGMTACIGGASDGSSGAMIVSVIFWILGIGTYIRARFGAWWHHG